MDVPQSRTFAIHYFFNYHRAVYQLRLSDIHIRITTMPSQRVILITGASGGIGRQCAVSLSNAFPSSSQPEELVLVLSGRREAELKATAEACREGTVTEVAIGDVSSEEDVQRMFATVKEKYGRLDMLFNVSPA